MSEQPAQTIIGELRELKSLAEEISESLKNQREILQKRGMNLPPMVGTTLSAIKGDLEKIETSLYEEQTELGQLRALADMSTKINSSLDINTVLEDAMDVVITLTGAERGYIILKNERTGELEFRVSRDNELAQARTPAGTAPQLSTTILTDVFSSGKALLADNAYGDERFQGNLSVANYSLRSVLCVPLNYKDETIGVVYVDNRLRAGIFQEREMNLLMAFANTAAVAIANARLYARLQRTLAEITQVKDLMDSVFASIGSGVIATDAEDLITTFNRAAESILSRASGESIGRPLRTAIPKMPPDLDVYLAQVREERRPQIIESEFELEERGRVAVNMKLTPLLDYEQQTQGVALVLDDVTEQKEREQELSIIKRYLPPQMVDRIHEISGLALGGEKRSVSCLFAEVRPLWTLPPDLRPAEIMDLMNDFLAVATDCVHEAGGVIDKYMGNELMALFNSQLNPMEDHAARAIYAALLMRDGFVELYKRLGISPDPHFYRIGINSGVATLGNVGSLNRRDFTAIGDTINLSKRLQENAKEGQIIISEETREHLEAQPGDLALSLELVEGEPMQVKGRQQKTRNYEVFKA